MNRVYLDHAATTPLAPAVFDAMKPHLTDRHGNPSSVHRAGRRARHALEESRERVAACLGAEPGEIVFTSGGTEANNTALKGVLAADRPPATAAPAAVREKADAGGAEAGSVEASGDGAPAGDRAPGGPLLVTSATEHEAVLRPAERMAERGVPVAILAPGPGGTVTPDQVEAAVGERTRLVSIMHANNETGAMTDVEAVADVCHAHGVTFHCDAVQTAGLLPLDVKAMGVDLLSVSGHKFYGPKGVGALYVRGGVELDPLVEGGSQERRRRGGTENVAAAVGLAEALERAREAAGERVDRLRALQHRLIDGLDAAVDGPYVLNTPVEDGPVAPHVVNVAFPPVDGEALDGEMLILNLDMKGVAASAGSACTSGALEPSHVLSALGLERETAAAALRFSMGRSTTADDVDYALDQLRDILQRMRG
jgi:cysteine desulfurase